MAENSLSKWYIPNQQKESSPASSQYSGTLQYDAGDNQEQYNAQNESPLEQGARLGAQAATRGLGFLGGGIPDLASGVLGLGKWATGGRTPSYQELQEMSPLGLPPTSSQIKGKIGELTKGYTDPQGPWEESIGDWAELVGSFLIPGAAGGKLAKAGEKVLGSSKAAKIASKGIEKYFLPFSGSKMGLARAASTVTVGKAAQQAGSYLGLSPAVQTALQVGSQIAMGTKGTRDKLENVVEPNLYKASLKELQPKRVNGIWHPERYTDISSTRNFVKKAKDRVTDTLHPHSEELNKYYDEVLNALEKIAPGDQSRAKVSDLLNLKINNNKWVSAFDTRPLFAGAKYLPKEARSDVAKITGLIRQPIEKVAKEDRKFGKLWNQAEDLHKGLNAFDKGTRWLHDNIGITKNLQDTLTKAGSVSAITVPLALSGKNPMWVGAGLAGLKGAREVALLKNVLQKSPVARKYYLEGMAEAAKENSYSASRLFDKLAKEVSEQYF